ncbi:hypothetical protein AVEN_193211-1 [Araneus ventricosus]|uniref:Uncharacterized protein n=1 Tax=Araneus ventricosus TaxID=182803 RepID=A0A4Y2B185_ARAVE|nr:hypothetical protein AVEN_193211-1 [Araneus ventricosus]
MVNTRSQTKMADNVKLLALLADLKKGQEEIAGLEKKMEARSAAEVLQGIPADKLTDLTTIEETLESRFGHSHLIQVYRTGLKTRLQKPGESIQVLAADVERPMSLAYRVPSGCSGELGGPALR